LTQLLFEPPELLLPEEDELLEEPPEEDDMRGPSLLTRSTWNSLTSHTS
jgi:hypothetical protein